MALPEPQSANVGQGSLSTRILNTVSEPLVDLMRLIDSV